MIRSSKRKLAAGPAAVDGEATRTDAMHQSRQPKAAPLAVEAFDLVYPAGPSYDAISIEVAK